MKVPDFVRREFKQKLRRISAAPEEKVQDLLISATTWAGSVSVTPDTDFLSKEEVFEQVIAAVSFDFDVDTLLELLEVPWEMGVSQPMNYARLRTRANVAWKAQLAKGPSGQIDTGVANLISFFTEDPDWEGGLGDDTLMKKIVICRPLPLALDVGDMDRISSEEDSAIVKKHLDVAPDFILPATVSHPAAFGLMSTWFRNEHDLIVNSKEHLGRSAM